MPCGLLGSENMVTYLPMENPETTAQVVALKKVADKLTHENDMLREELLRIAEINPKLLKPAFVKKINAAQIKHRKEDLQRLEQTFRTSKDAEKLGLVMLADPNKPLEPQLGFDPDAY
jgi:hypothetical protein